MSDDDRIAQVGEAARQTASEVETLSARVVDLEAHLQTMAETVRALRTVQAESADRLERIVAEFDFSAPLSSLAAQLEAARAAQLRTSDRMETLASFVERVDGMEGALTRLSREVAAQIDERDISVRAEIKAVADRQTSERDATARAVSGLVGRLEQLTPVQDRLQVVERRLAEADAVHAQLAARVEEIAATRHQVEETVLQADRRQQARVDDMVTELAELRGEIEAWRGRIDDQNETVREARTIVEEASEQVRSIRDAHHATAEAQRVSEGRVDSALSAMRSESAQVWERFAAERRNEWEALERSRADRGRELDALAENLEDLAAGLDGLSRRAADDVDALNGAVEMMRREMAEILRVWRAGMDTATEIVESSLPADERTNALAERREATRRALRTQRDTRES